MAGNGDIQITLGGRRMAWRPVSAAGRGWASAHPDLSEAAPEDVECLAAFVEPLVERAIMDGLTIMAGDLKVTLCR